MDSNVIIKSGHFQSAGTEYELVLGFVPDYVKLVNVAAVDTEILVFEWWRDMGAAAGVAYYVDADGNVGTAQYISSGGPITELDETEIDTGTLNDDDDPVRVTGKQGVTIAAGFMDNDDEIYFRAERSSDDEDIGDVA